MALDKTLLCTEMTVDRVIQETHDTSSIVLKIPTELSDKFKYKAGQFVTFFLTVNGEEIRRSYSLASAPTVDPDFKVSVKRVPGGKGSNYLLDQVKTGSKLWTTPPAGHFVLPPDLTNMKLVFYAGGSGITPIISIIKYVLHHHKSVPCGLVYQNRDERSIIFNEEIKTLQEKYPEQFKVEHLLSQPSSAWVRTGGRIEKKHIRDFLAKNSIGIRALHYICGPEGFMKTVERALADLSVDSNKIKVESFASPAELHTQLATPAASVDELDEDAILIGDHSQKSAPEKLTAVFDGQTVEISCPKDRSVLESLLAAGHNPPYSCMDGACMACLAKVQEGLVYQNDLGILTDDNVAAKECLTCQAFPLSKKIKINFDSF